MVPFFTVVIRIPLINWQLVTLVAFDSLCYVASGQLYDKDFFIVGDFVLIVHDQLKRVGDDLFEWNNWLGCVSRSRPLPVLFVVVLADLVYVGNCVHQLVKLIVTKLPERRRVLNDHFDFTQTPVKLCIFFIFTQQRLGNDLKNFGIGSLNVRFVLRSKDLSSLSFGLHRFETRLSLGTEKLFNQVSFGLLNVLIVILESIFFPL